jgi:hypothetical protein
MNALARASSNCDRPILSSERMLYKDYDLRCSNEEKNLAVNLNGLGTKN